MLTFKTLRRIIAFLTFWGITLVCLDFTGTFHAWFSWLAKIQFWPAIYALHVVAFVCLSLLTLLLGRIYCSIICPLGIMQDGIAWIHKRVGKVRYHYTKPKHYLRIIVLVFFIAFALGGINIGVSFLEPYSSFLRMMTTLFRPLYMLGNNALAFLAERADSYAFYSREVLSFSIVLIVIVALHFLLIAVMAWRGGRTYCNTICPVGSILGYFSQYSVFHVVMDAEKCKKCGKCAHHCKSSCIDIETHTVDASRCVKCGNCIDECHFDAITISPMPTLRKRGEELRTAFSKEKNNSTEAISPSSHTEDSGGLSRRSFLIGTALTATSAAFAEEQIKMDGGLAVIEDKIAPERKTKLTPAGSFSAQHFAQHCTACQLCVSECPNDVLRPQTSLEHFMQPTMSYEHGYCRPECTRCADVCPTSAIQKIEKAEKSAIKIGTAVWIKKNCLPVSDGVSCGNCARHCPAGAIEMIPLNDANGEETSDTKIMIPAINESLCIGCGACENLCPARPFSAIVVEGSEVHQEI